MNKPHKHAELIKAWAEGAEIEWHCYFNNKWFDASLSPSWDNDTEFRVKPVKKWTPKYTIDLVSDDVKNYWNLTKFIEEFETDWGNQNYQLYKLDDGKYTAMSDGTNNFSLGTLTMSEDCAKLLAEMLNNGEIEL